jgi:DNA-binding transcriptional ArsR family regulator
MMAPVSRAATTSDPFNAIAEPRRRELLGLLSAGEASVGELVSRSHLAQPQVSKHLHVLRSVDLVRCRTVGRQRFYRLNGDALKPVHDWIDGFADHWNARLDRLDDLLVDLAADTRKPESIRETQTRETRQP